MKPKHILQLGALLLAVTTCSATNYPGGLIKLAQSYDGEIFNSTDGTTYINTTVNFIADATFDPSEAGQELVPLTDILYYNASPSTTPALTLAMTVKTYSEDEVTLFMYCSHNSTADAAYNTQLFVDLRPGLMVDYGTFDYAKPNFSFPTQSPITIVDGRLAFTWNIGDLSGNTSNTSFRAELQKSQLSVYNWFQAELTWNDSTSSNQFGPMIASVCIERFINYEESVLYQHGFTALSFFMAFILGIILVTIFVCLYFALRRKKAISPHKVHNARVIHERGKTIMMSDTEAMKKGGHTINEYRQKYILISPLLQELPHQGILHLRITIMMCDTQAIKKVGHTINVHSIVGEGDSIIGVLGMKDKIQMHREIDSLDVVNTVNIDTDIEKERNDASMATTELLLTGLLTNKDIDKGTLETTINNLRARRTHLDKQQDDDYKRELKKLYKKISAKNRAMMNSLLTKQRNEKKDLVSSTQNLPEKERNEMLNLMNEQHLMEQNGETFKLKLEQDEETEKLRKEFAIGVRMGLKEIQLQALADVRDQGQLSDPQMKWLMAEHSKTQKALEGLYDEEISKQRMKLEEKLARRRALAQAAETQEENNDDILNTIAGQQITTITKLKKSKVISAANANELIEDSKRQMIAIKERMEKERQSQEAALHKRLSELKKARLSDLNKEHEAELREYDRKSQEMQTEGPIDPVTYADGRLKLLSQQREERTDLENEVDTEHSVELTKLRDSITTQTEQELETVGNGIQAKLPQDGSADDIVERMMRDHRQEVSMLRASQERSRQKQLHKLQARLEENREHWNQRKESERVEQEQLREYEDQVVKRLVNSQVSMSDEERNRILKEHEKHMVTLENSLTLNKLRQKRMFEEKLAMRRAQQLEKLQLKQHKEVEVRRRQMENNGEDSNDEDFQRGRVEQMKEHVEQKMAVLQGKKLDWDSELESIRVEMLKERSLSLKEQEERLGALVAELQLSKAKELSKIEEQQLAIHNLKTSLLDDLNQRGVLSDPETQAVIKRHHEEQEALNNRLEVQRVSQEQALKQKLQLRLEQREKSMIAMQDEELKNLMAPSKTAAKIKKMLLIHNHMVAMEKLRNQLDREISQTLEQVRYEYDMLKRKAIQDQELEFIAGLVRVGAIPRAELENVLKMLYPNKTEAEFKEIFEKIFDPKLMKDQDKKHEELSQLAERVRQIQKNPPPMLRRASQMTMGDSLKHRKNSLKKQKKTFSAIEQQQMYDDDGYDANARFRPTSRQQSFDDGHPQPYPRTRKQPFDDHPQPYPRSRPSYEDHPHPLELGKPNGHAYHNPIMEEDDDEVVTAQYRGDYDQSPRQPPAKLPPLQTKKKKKKARFLKKASSPRVDENYYDDE